MSVPCFVELHDEVKITTMRCCLDRCPALSPKSFIVDSDTGFQSKTYESVAPHHG